MFVYDATKRCASRDQRSRLPLTQFGACRSNFLAEPRIHDNSTAYIAVHAPVVVSNSRRPSSPSLRTHQSNAKMVPKPQGQAVQSVTHRPLPPLPKLRVRRPNKPETNPCLGAMSSVLGTFGFIVGMRQSAAGRLLVRGGKIISRKECGLTRQLQVVGHHQDTACKDAQR